MQCHPYIRKSQTRQLGDLGARKLLELEKIGHCVQSVALSPDGKRIVVGSWSVNATVWDAETGQEKAILKGHAREVQSVAWSPDGKRVLTGSWDSTARIWDAETGLEESILQGHTNAVWSVAWSRDGKRVLTGSYDSTARIWDSSARNPAGSER